MVGNQGSGKSTFAKKLCANLSEDDQIKPIESDKLKTIKRMESEAIKLINLNNINNQNSPIVIDATHGSKEKRKHWIDFAQKHNLPIRAIWVTTSIDDAMERNKQRAAETKTPKIPDVAFYIYRKNFEIPSEAEGFKLIVV
jgi:bifunctional polynucleotide phosphatase/kinase